ncbi:hypothetical protein BJ546DRAFT_547532 [Cryomyces antarcticus]
MSAPSVVTSRGARRGEEEMAGVMARRARQSKRKRPTPYSPGDEYGGIRTRQRLNQTWIVVAIAGEAEAGTAKGNDFTANLTTFVRSKDAMEPHCHWAAGVMKREEVGFAAAVTVATAVALASTLFPAVELPSQSGVSPIARRYLTAGETARVSGQSGYEKSLHTED